ncbi:MAG: GNAT family protein [Haloarculaceae archaeon]
MPGPVFLRGDRVGLHPIEEADLSFLAEQMNDPDVWRTLRTRVPKNQRTEREWWEGLDERDGVTLLVAADGDPVGTVGFHDVNADWGTATVGYAVHPDHWGNGYATEAVALLTRYAFAERRLQKLSADVYAHNPASMRVLEKAGWHEEAVLEREAFVGGERVDLHRFAAHADVWVPASDRARAALREASGRSPDED